MATNKEELFECVIPLPDSLIRKTMDEPTKSVKHGDHDQSDHGNWAHGGSATEEEKAAAEEDRRVTTRRGVTPEVLAAVEKYTQGKTDSGEMVARQWNSGLRSGEIKPGDNPEIDALIDFTSSNVITEDTTLHRGMVVQVPSDLVEDIVGGDEIFQVPGVRYNSESVQKGFTSASPMSYAAQEFAKGKFDDSEEDDGDTVSLGVVMEIEVPEGTPGASIQGLSGSYLAENEVILPPGTTISWGEGEWLGDDETGYLLVPGTVVPTQTKSIKHEAGPDHDQADHGNWARGGARVSEHAKKFESAGGRVVPFRWDQADSSTRDALLKELERTQYGPFRKIQEFVDEQESLFSDNPKAVSPEELDAARRIAKGYHMTMYAMQQGIRSTSEPKYQGGVFVAMSDKDTLAGALYYTNGEDAVQAELLGSTQEVSGTGSALMLQGMEFALSQGKGFAVMDPAEDAEPWYDSLGLPKATTVTVNGESRWARLATLDELRHILGKATKSLKHGDHDQSTHGSWAHGTDFLAKYRSEKAIEEFWGSGKDHFSESAKDWELNRAAAKRARMTDPELLALMAYGATGARDVNRSLRLGKNEESELEFWHTYPPDQQAAISQLLDSAMERSSLSEQTTLYRGMSLHVREDAEFLKPGTVFTDPGYGSTSESEEIARRFAMGYGRSNDPHHVVWEIDAPKGYPAIPLSKILAGKDSDEKEVVLARDAHYRIDSVQTLPNTETGEPFNLIHVKATLLPIGTTKSLKHGDHDQNDHGNWARKFPLVNRLESEKSPKDSKTTTPLWWMEQGHGSAITRETTEALDAYTHGKTEFDDGTPVAFHAALNERLRNGMDLDEAIKRAAEEFADEGDQGELHRLLSSGFSHFDRLTQTSQMKEDTVVTRAMAPIFDEQELETAMSGGSLNLYGQEIAPGAVFSDAGYVSTSADTTGWSTEYFTHNWGDIEWLGESQIPTSVRWMITVPAGSPAADLRSIGFASKHNEQEVILPRNTHFRVDSFEVKPPPAAGDAASVTIRATVVPMHDK